MEYTNFINEINGTNNKMTLTFVNVKSGLVVAVLAAIIASAWIVVLNGGVFNLDWHVLVNAAVTAFLASIIKDFGTTPSNGISTPINTGSFAGIQVK